MFNSKFNLSKFNEGKETETLPFVSTFSETMGVQVSYMVILFIDNLPLSSNFELKTNGALGIKENINGVGLLDFIGSPFISVPLKSIMYEDFNVNSGINANFVPHFDVDCNFIGEYHAGAFFFEKDIECKGNVSTNIFLGSNETLDIEISEMLMMSTMVSEQEELNALFSVVLPPNSELRIDSENYTVTLNGVNILHLHSGDWIFINRNLKLLSIDSGTGNQFETEVIYTERFL